MCSRSIHLAKFARLAFAYLSLLPFCKAFFINLDTESRGLVNIIKMPQNDIDFHVESDNSSEM